MPSTTINRIISTVKDCKIVIAICAVAFILGGVLALFYDLPDVFVENLSASYPAFADSSTASLIVRFICDGIILLIVFLCGLTVFSIPVNLLFLCYRGFITVLYVKYIVAYYSAAGAVISVILIFPSAILSAASLTLACALSVKRLNGEKIVRINCVEGILIDYLVCLVICLFAALYCLFIDFLILRPLNYSY